MFTSQLDPFRPLRAGPPVVHRLFLARCRPPVSGFAVDPGEDAGLNRVGVLVLVDESARVLATNAGRETHSARAVKRTVKLDQQIVVAKAPVLPHPPVDGFADLIQRFPAGPTEPAIEDRPELPGHLLQAIECLEQWVLRRRAALPAGLGKALPAVAPNRSFGRQPRLGRGEQRLDAGQVPLDGRATVAVPVHPASIEKLRGKRIPVLLPGRPRRLELATPRRLPGVERLGQGFAAEDGDTGPRPPARHPAGELAREEPVLDDVAHQQRRGRIEPATPEVPHRAGHHPVVVAAHLESEREAALEGEIG